MSAREEVRARRLGTDAIIDLVIETTQPPDFGVEYETAVVMVGRLRRERYDYREETRPRRLFWLDMLRRVDRLMAPPYNLRLCAAVQKVLAYQRPSKWYMSKAAAHRLIRADSVLK
ncbi:MAG: hypothetical protein K2L80_06250 [Muribaculaceae bacterium]|nr:hypothetical protein [Muribaculaceae bacterium]